MLIIYIVQKEKENWVYPRVKWSVSCSVMFWLFVTPWTQPIRLFCLWSSPVKNTGVGCHFLLQEIFPTQGSNWVSCITGRFFYHLSHQGSPVPGWCWPHGVSWMGSSGFTHSRRLSTVGHAILAALAGLISYWRKLKKCARKLTWNF